MTGRSAALRAPDPDGLDIALLRVSQKNTVATVTVQVAAAAAASMMFLAGPGSRTWYAVWLALALGVCAARLRVDRALTRRLARQPEPTLASLRPWALAHCAGVAASGAGWAILAWMRLPQEDSQTQFVILIVLSALAGGAIGMLAPLRITGRIYVTLLLVPGCVRLLLDGSSLMVLGGLGLVFWGVMIAGHRNNHALLVRSIALGRENLGLVETLRARNDEIGRINQTLEQRVAERTQALEALAVDAEAGSRAKTAFLATIGHEIRTPLNGVLGMAQIMARGPLDADQRDRLSVIGSSAATLLAVVNDVLDISKIETGAMDVAPAPFRLDLFADGIRRLYGILAQEKGLGFSLSLADPVGGWRHGDEVRLRQIASNLISNALKSTGAGEITVEIVADEEGLGLRVTDTGPGVAAEDLPQIFDRFVQADGSGARRARGTGRGLAICRELANLMGGGITVSSTVGVGSCFTVTLPMPATPQAAGAASATAPAPAAPDPGPDGVRILVVDDDPTNRLVMQALLTEFGLASDAAVNGLEALAAWEAREWDAILMDVQMPEMDGLDATRAIRAGEVSRARARTPIIAITAAVLSHETETYRAAGMDDVVSKPVDVHQLLDSLSRQLTRLEVA